MAPGAGECCRGTEAFQPAIVSAGSCRCAGGGLRRQLYAGQFRCRAGGAAQPDGWCRVCADVRTHVQSHAPHVCHAELDGDDNRWAAGGGRVVGDRRGPARGCWLGNRGWNVYRTLLADSGRCSGDAACAGAGRGDGCGHGRDPDYAGLHSPDFAGESGGGSGVCCEPFCVSR